LALKKKKKKKKRRKLLLLLLRRWLMDIYAAKVESHPTDKLYFGLTAEMVLGLEILPPELQQGCLK
jgi:hypothetical protein